MAARDDPLRPASPATTKSRQSGHTGAGALAGRVSAELAEFLDAHAELLLSLHPDLALLAEAARSSVLDGGKRLRPTFAYWGWRGVLPEGAAGERHLVRAASSLELLQACALVHDDLMDGSDTRRGQPAAHVRFDQLHREQGWPGSGRSFGAAGAILLGDVLLSWAEEMFTGAISQLEPARTAAAEREFHLMRTEVVAGQFLDVLAQTRGGFDPDEALRVIRFKTSKYTVQRPLLLGAGAAGGSAAVLAQLSDYGHAIGEAFQLRDDLLGVFGDPAETGKPAGDDLREGKRTLLVALAMRAATGSQRQLLRAGIGKPELSEDEVTELQAVLHATGAPDLLEQRIVARTREATGCLTGGELLEPARAALLELAHTTTQRSF